MRRLLPSFGWVPVSTFGRRQEAPRRLRPWPYRLDDAGTTGALPAFSPSVSGYSPNSQVRGRSQSDTLVGFIVWSTTPSSSVVSGSRSICWRSRALKASIVLTASYLRRLKR